MKTVNIIISLEELLIFKIICKSDIQCKEQITIIIKQYGIKEDFKPNAFLNQKKKANTHIHKHSQEI